MRRFPHALITLPLSHCRERARRGLDGLALPYTEARHLQGFHWLPTLRAGGGRKVPVLIDGREDVSGSTGILGHSDACAPPEPRRDPDDAWLREPAEALEDRLDEMLGVESRSRVYFHRLTKSDEALEIASQERTGVHVPRLFETERARDRR